MGTKICSKCNIEKPLTEFQFRKDTGKYRNVCIKCNYIQRKEYKDKYYQEHKDDYKKYRENKKEYLKEYFKHNYENKREEKILKKRLHYQENKERLLEVQKEYRKTHRKEISQRLKNKRETDPIYKLKVQIRAMIKKSFIRKGYSKNANSYKIIGLEYDKFIEYLLNTYKTNYGIEWDLKEEVHIDHIIPLATAKTEEDVLKLCHYTNLQLLKAKDNLDKKDKLNWKLK